MRIIFPGIALISLLVAAPAFSQSQSNAPAPAAADKSAEPVDTGANQLMIGIGVAAVPSYLGSNDEVIVPVPGVRGRISGFNFSLRGNRFSMDLIREKPGPGWDFQLGPVAQVDFNRTLGVVDPRVKLLPKRKTAVELGGFAGIGRRGIITNGYDELEANVSYVHDVAGSHNSYIITPNIDYGTPLSHKMFVLISASADYMGQGYGQTYFGVDAAASAASGLPIYNAHKGWNDWSLSAVGDVSLTGDLTHGFSLVGAVSYSRLIGSAGATPLTSIAGSPNQWIGALGLAYTF